MAEYGRFSSAPTTQGQGQGAAQTHAPMWKDLNLDAFGNAVNQGLGSDVGTIAWRAKNLDPKNPDKIGQFGYNDANELRKQQEARLKAAEREKAVNEANTSAHFDTQYVAIQEAQDAAFKDFMKNVESGTDINEAKRNLDSELVRLKGLDTFSKERHKEALNNTGAFKDVYTYDENAMDGIGGWTASATPIFYGLGQSGYLTKNAKGENATREERQASYAQFYNDITEPHNDRVKVDLDFTEEKIRGKIMEQVQGRLDISAKES